MHLETPRRGAVTLMVAVTVFAFSGWASADPPARVARLAFVSGSVTLSPSGEGDWIQGTINRPLTTGDRLWADALARTEIQVGGAMIRMGGETGVSIVNLDDNIAQLQLKQGVLNVHVRHLEPGQTLEVDTPSVAFALRQPGDFRIEVDANGQATTIVVRTGQGEVYGKDGSFVIDPRQSYRFTGSGLRTFRHVATPRVDAFDRWSSGRDRHYDTSASARHVSPDVVGFQDLDAAGTWRVHAPHGQVWFPHRVAAGWTPYRDGHWSWIDPWGWTWVDDAPWGFVVSHYGRWTNIRGAWGWVPGSARARAVYAPALVVFVGGGASQPAIAGAVGAVAWFPLGPREVYQPPYPVSALYFEKINHSNAAISRAVVNNSYSNANVANVVHANRRVPGAVIAVPASAFAQSQPVSAVQMSADRMTGAPLTAVPHPAPMERNVRSASAQGDKPPPRVFLRSVVARTVPPAAPVGTPAQPLHVAAKPGVPPPAPRSATLTSAAD